MTPNPFWRILMKISAQKLGNFEPQNYANLAEGVRRCFSVICHVWALNTNTQTF
jgi:hypothetical protein